LYLTIKEVINLAEAIQKAEPVEGRLIASLENRMEAISLIFHYVGIAAMLGMVGIVFFSAIGRYGLNHPIPGSTEIANFLMVTIAFMMAGYTQARRGHVNIPIVLDALPKTAQAIVNMLTYLVLLIVCAIGVFQSIKQAIYIATTGTWTPILHIPFTPFYYIVALGWLSVTIVAFLQWLVYVLKVVKHG
jgi:TRAP-type C4-dicarboxylate transport system permease small subunit